MVQFLVKRFIGLIFVIIGVTFITFILGYFAPGDPIRELLGNHVTPQVYNNLKEAYGLNLPWYQQYWNVGQYGWNEIQIKLAPILVFAAVGTALFARLARTSMLEVLRQDYVRTARAKGMRERSVVYRHAFRNAMIPLVTVFGLSIGLLVTGAFFIEQIFNIPGIGQQTITSINNRDYPVIQATTVLLAVAVVVGNLISDVLYSIVDPRIEAE